MPWAANARHAHGERREGRIAGTPPVSPETDVRYVQARAIISGGATPIS